MYTVAVVVRQASRNRVLIEKELKFLGKALSNRKDLSWRTRRARSRTVRVIEADKQG
jgi:hypothetical protein